MIVRPAVVSDAHALAELLTRYLAEQFPTHAGTPVELLARDVLSGVCGQRVLVAAIDGNAIGFIAWDRVYDMHWGKGGVQVADLFVVPAHRGLGVAGALAAAVCDAGRAEGAQYLPGGSYDRASAVGRFYERIAVASDSAVCHCSGAAFRALADLHGQPARVIARGLPPKELNYVE